MDLSLNRLQNLIVERDRIGIDSFNPETLAKLSPRAIAILYQCNALAGEAGELSNIAKKIARDELLTFDEQMENEQKARDKGYINACDWRTQEAGKELGDIVMYAALAAQALGVVLSQEVIDKFNEVTEKMGDKARHLTI